MASMGLTLDQSLSADYIRFVSRYCGGNQLAASASQGPVRMRVGNSATLHQVNTICRCLARAASRESELCGSTPLEVAEISQWMSFALKCMTRESAKLNKGEIQIINQALQKTTYFASPSRPTLADVAIFWIVYRSGVSTKGEAEFIKYKNLSRWFNLMQHSAGIRGSKFVELVEFPLEHFHLMKAL